MIRVLAFWGVRLGADNRPTRYGFACPEGIPPVATRLGPGCRGVGPGRRPGRRGVLGASQSSLLATIGRANLFSPCQSLSSQRGFGPGEGRIGIAPIEARRPQ